MSDSKIDGVDGILAQLDNLVSVQRYTQALQTACALVERSAKQKAPKGDGALRQSITSTVADMKGIVFTPLEYAPYVEYGTGLFAEGGNGRTWDLPWAYQDERGEWHTSSGQEPHPFMRPALDENRQQILALLRGGNKR